MERRLISAALAVFAFSQTGNATAVMTQLKPPTCPATRAFSWNYRVGGGTGVFDLPSDPACSSTPGNPCPHYINNLSNTRYLVANKWVGYIGLRVAFFQTESSFDYLKWSLFGYDPSSASGSVGGGSVLWANTGASFGSTRMQLDFLTDRSVTMQGVYLDQIEACTYRTAIDTAASNGLPINYRVHGILMGSDDVIYFSFPANAIYHYSIAMWNDMPGMPDPDFNLYARCNAVPTESQYGWRGASAYGQEFIDVTGCTGTVHVAVHARIYGGPFSIVRGLHRPNAHQTLRAGTNFNASTAQLQTFADTLRRGVRHFFGATEGERYYGDVHLYDSQACGSSSCGGAACNVCFRNDAGRSNASCDGRVDLYSDAWNSPEAFSHELGHYALCIPDEYGASGIPACGHSIMASPYGTNNNLCVSLDHAKDSRTTEGAPASSAWNLAYSAGRVISSYNVTLDNYDYVDFDFNNLVGNVTTH